ncbi:hypothetical protein [Rhodococcus coprophilus]|uniref:hypothetical protein n=1 Tax=Rhodococcus coprophilus TaxID=38310 RepID=UPI0033E6EBC5
MIEALVGIHATDGEPDQARSGPPARTDNDPSGVGVSLERLLALVKLTPAQAAVLVTDVVDQVESLHELGRSPASLRGNAVTVSQSGHLRIERGGGNAGSRDKVRDVIAVLLREIAANCRSAAFADRLDESIAEASDAVVLAQLVRNSVATEFGPDKVETTRRQLAALVSAVLGRARPEGPAHERPDAPDQLPPATGSSLASTGWQPPTTKIWHRKRRRPSWRRGLLALLALLMLAGMVWVAPKAWSELRQGWNTLLDPGESSMDDQISPVSPPPPAPDAVFPPAEPGSTEPSPVPIDLPGEAGPITRMVASFANGTCEPGRSCNLRVDVGVDPAANVAAVTWNLTVYDRCTGAVGPGGEVTVPVPPGAPEAYGVGRVDLPPGSALAVAAVSTAPAAAASEPLYVPAENVTCPPGGPRAGG